MIKKIRVDQLRIGMFIHDFTVDLTGKNGSIKQLLIKHQKSIETIQSLGIKEVYIDTAKERKTARAKTVQEIQSLIDNELHKLARETPSIPPKVPLKEEIQLAKTITKEAVGVIQRALKSGEKDMAIDVNDAYRLVQKMGASVSRNQDALILLTRIKKKDEYTLMHSISVGALVLTFCKFCHVPYEMTMNLALGGLLHDLGKTRIPHSILNKPGKLTDSEFDTMKKHPKYSAKIMQNVSGLPFEACDIALHHHERFDGTGYPDGLKGGRDFIWLTDDCNL